MINTAVAILAPIVNCVYQIPQLVKVIKTKSVDDISLYTLCLLILTNILWLLHGYFIADTALLVASVLNLSINIPLTFMYFKHRTKSS
jgi:MtN3 and saliva related transmembrane protein